MRIHGKILMLAGLVLIFMLPLALGGCGLDRFYIEKEPLKTVPAVPEDARPSPVGFNKINFSIPTGTPVLAQQFLGCEPPFGIVQSGISSRNFPDDDFRRIFFDALDSQGYDVAGDPGRMFDEYEDSMRANYAVGARVTDLKINSCNRINLWGYPSGETGEAQITVEWTVYEILRQKKAYKTTTKGYTKLKLANLEALQLMLEQSFAAATYNLGADQQFHDLVFFGKQPEKPPETIEDPDEEPIRLFESAEAVSVAPMALSSEPVVRRIEKANDPVVMIQVAGGHGSGFLSQRKDIF